MPDNDFIAKVDFMIAEKNKQDRPKTSNMGKSGIRTSQRRNIMNSSAFQAIANYTP